MSCLVPNPDSVVKSVVESGHDDFPAYCQCRLYLFQNDANVKDSTTEQPAV